MICKQYIYQSLYYCIDIRNRCGLSATIFTSSCLFFNYIIRKFSAVVVSSSVMIYSQEFSFVIQSYSGTTVTYLLKRHFNFLHSSKRLNYWKTISSVISVLIQSTYTANLLSYKYSISE